MKTELRVEQQRGALFAARARGVAELMEAGFATADTSPHLASIWDSEGPFWKNESDTVPPR